MLVHRKKKEEGKRRDIVAVAFTCPFGSRLADALGYMNRFETFLPLSYSIPPKF